MNKRHKAIIVSTLIVFIIFISLSPFIFTRPGVIDFSQTGQIGDTISGTMSPFIGILTAILTFIAFYIQFQANEEQKESLKKQEASLALQIRMQKVDSFEKELLQYIQTHRENIEGIRIEYVDHGVSKVASGVNYLWMIQEIIEDTYNHLRKRLPNDKWGNSHVLIASYLFMYYGDGLWNNEGIKSKFEQYINIPSISAMRGLTTRHNSAATIFRYGFGVNLSIVYRNLYNAYKYIKETKIDEEFNSQKYNYGKKIRSNISNIEQLLLYYNILSPLGEVWAKERLVYDYKLLKNIPLQIAIGYPPDTWLQETYYIDDSRISGFFEQME